MKFDKLLDLTEYLHVLFCCFFVFTSFLENMVVFFLFHCFLIIFLSVCIGEFVFLWFSVLHASWACRSGAGPMTVPAMFKCVRAVGWLFLMTDWPNILLSFLQ